MSEKLLEKENKNNAHTKNRELKWHFLTVSWDHLRKWSSDAFKILTAKKALNLKFQIQLQQMLRTGVLNTHSLFFFLTAFFCFKRQGAKTKFPRLPCGNGSKSHQSPIEQTQPGDARKVESREVAATQRCRMFRGIYGKGHIISVFLRLFSFHYCYPEVPPQTFFFL